MVVQCTYKVQHPKVVDCAFSRKSLNGGAPCLCLAPLRRLTDLGVRAVHNVMCTCLGNIVRAVNIVHIEHCVVCID